MAPLLTFPNFYANMKVILRDFYRGVVCLKTADKQFYRSFFAVVVPIAIQNLINSAVGMADTLMLGFVSQTAMASNSLAGQIHFILNMFYSGLAAGTTMLAAQYWGRQNMKAIEHILAIGVKLAAAVGVLFFVATVFFPAQLMRIYTNDPSMIEAGAAYLQIVGWSYLFMGLSHPYLSILKSVERAKISTLINSSALLINVVLNATFIFGWIPGVAPMGIQGVALATVISRIGEFLLCLAYGQKFQVLRLRPGLFTMFNRVLWRDFIRYSLPALGNECVFAVGSSMYSVIMGRLGEDLVAANSIMASLRSVATVLGFGVANGTAILLGKAIGAGDMGRQAPAGAHLFGVAAGQRGGAGGVSHHHPHHDHPLGAGPLLLWDYDGHQRGVRVGPAHEHLLDVRRVPRGGRLQVRLYSGRHLHVGGYGAPGAALRFCAEAAAHVGVLHFKPGRDH